MSCYSTAQARAYDYLSLRCEVEMDLKMPPIPPCYYCQ
ncbi:hypothetical protein L914_18000 [Phytophthora nicotianae]|uniref:Uncharacterized protein n=1 Tax=Phytophthora nicotianae TaxID=4792 RepID=W2MHS2_PHYNI|nr:hypothetical protein L914_18000 [Phytophthora nicotianae]